MKEERLLRACRGQEVDCTPVWFMRQAGRYMAEYREIRKRYPLVEICKRPELAAEVTLQPVRRFDVDAAIIFADILLPLPEMGVPFHFSAGEGPVIEKPVRSPEDVDQLRVGEPETALRFVFDAIRLVRETLQQRVPLIGFAAAPFTLASYMIEGGYSRHFSHTKLLMHRHPEAWHRLMELIAEMTLRYLKAQVEAGAQVIQLFDSWVGCLGPEDYRSHVLPYSRKIFQHLKQLAVPSIHFSTGTAGYLSLLREAGGDVLSVDWRISLRRVRETVGDGLSLQGNLDPVLLLGPAGALKEKVLQVLEEAGPQPGHIFNLGHGILPQTPVETVEQVVEWVHQESRR